MKFTATSFRTLLLASAVLLFTRCTKTGETPTAQSAAPTEAKIAYINADSVLKNYDFLKVEQEKFDVRGKKIEQDLKTRATALQSEINAFQNNYSNMTIGQAEAVKEDLARKNQNFEMNREKVTQELMVEQEKLNKELYDRITVFLKGYSERNGLQMVLKFNTESDVLYAAPGLDITADVIKGLNDEYSKESGKLKTPEPEKKK